MNPGATKGAHRARRFNPDRDVEEWHGKYLPYDLVKEFTIAFVKGLNGEIIEFFHNEQL